MTVFEAKQLAASADTLAPDGSEVRVLVSATRGSMAHFRLSPGQVSRAVAHHTVEEVWFVLAGRGQMWLMREGRESIINLKPGLSLAVSVGAHFQFRNDGTDALDVVGVTMPPWPGEAEAHAVPGKW